MNFSEGFWYILGKAVVTLFLLIAGVSFFFSSQKRTFSQVVSFAVYRFFVIGFFAGVITLITVSFFYEQRIYFGVLHFFAISSLLMPPFLVFRSYSILVGLVVLLIGFLLQFSLWNSDILFPFGMVSSDFFSADYYPIFPWFGYILIGYGLAYHLDSKNRLVSYLSGSFIFGRIFAIIGRHAFVVYLAHIPILYILMTYFFG